MCLRLARGHFRGVRVRTALEHLGIDSAIHPRAGHAKSEWLEMACAGRWPGLGDSTDASPSAATSCEAGVQARAWRSRIWALAHCACSATNGSGSAAARLRAGRSSAVPVLPRATQTLRRKRGRLRRLIGERANRARNAGVVEIEEIAEAVSERSPGGHGTPFRGTPRRSGSTGRRRGNRRSRRCGRRWRRGTPRGSGPCVRW